MFSGRKKPLQELLAAVLSWVNGAAGQPALQLKRHIGTTYNTAFVWQHKLREALVRGYNVGLISGEIEMDGAHQSGRRADEKRGRPVNSRRTNPGDSDTPAPPESSLTMSGRNQPNYYPDGVVDPNTGRRLPPNRRFLISARKRSGVRGRGAAVSRVAIGRIEDGDTAKAVIRDYVGDSESVLHSDTGSAFLSVGRDFKDHLTVNHTTGVIGPMGENNNLSEEINGRFDRTEQGIHLNLEPKYLLDYAVETAFRADTRRLSNGAQLKLIISIACSVGESRYWMGFTHGNHRTAELTHPAPRPAPASGPEKGSSYIKQRKKRPPR